MKASRPINAPNGFPYLGMRSLRQKSTSQKRQERKILTREPRDLLSMVPWAAATKALSLCGGAAGSCPGSKPKTTCPVCHVSHVSRLIIPGAVHRSPGIYLTAEETLKNVSQEAVRKGCVTSHRLKWGPSSTNEVGRIAQHVKKGIRTRLVITSTV